LNFFYSKLERLLRGRELYSLNIIDMMCKNIECWKRM